MMEANGFNTGESFNFGYNWSGIIRLCPDTAFDLDKEDEISVERFEKVCNMGWGRKAAAPPDGINHFLVKWRGKFIDTHLPETMREDRNPDEMTTDIRFKTGPDGRLIMSGVMIDSCNIRPFTGVRIRDGKPRPPYSLTIDRIWEEYKFKYKEPLPPPAPKLWPWKAPVLARCVEKPSAWAWDVVGKWQIEAPQVADFLKVNKWLPITITIHLANAKARWRQERDFVVGRQLWAIVKFGDVIEGCMRFTPRTSTLDQKRP